MIKLYFTLEDANFETFGLSLMTLVRGSTGENWNGIMCVITACVFISGAIVIAFARDADLTTGILDNVIIVVFLYHAGTLSLSTLLSARMMHQADLTVAGHSPYPLYTGLLSL